MTSLHKAVISDPKKLAHEIASDVMASEDEIAEAIAAAIRASRNEVIEMCAKVADTEEGLRSGSQTFPCIAIAAVIRSLKDHSNG